MFGKHKRFCSSQSFARLTTAIETHLTLQARRRDREVNNRNPGAQVRREAGAWISSDEQQQKVGAVIDVLRAQADQGTAASSLQLAVEKRVEHRIHSLHILVNGDKPIDEPMGEGCTRVMLDRSGTPIWGGEY